MMARHYKRPNPCNTCNDYKRDSMELEDRDGSPSCIAVPNSFAGDYPGEVIPPKLKLDRRKIAAVEDEPHASDSCVVPRRAPRFAAGDPGSACGSGPHARQKGYVR